MDPLSMTCSMCSTAGQGWRGTRDPSVFFSCRAAKRQGDGLGEDRAAGFFGYHSDKARGSLPVSEALSHASRGALLSD